MPDASQNILHALQFNRLPSLPHVLVEIVNACQNDEATLQELADIVSRDVSISSRVISLANSSLFSRSASVHTLEHALIVLGSQKLKTIVITAAIHQFFSSFKHQDSEFLTAFWKNSLTCALLSKSLALLTNYSKPDEAYLCGLLHDIGSLVFATNHHEEYRKLLASKLDAQKRLTEEQDLFEVDHAELGALILEEWRLSSFASDAIRYHHAELSDISGAHHLTKLVYMASQLSTKQKKPASQEDLGSRLFELAPDLVKEMVRKIENEVQEIADSMGVMLDSSSANDDHSAQLQLARLVRDHSLLNSCQPAVVRTHTKSELATHISHSVSLLFGLRTSLLFWHEDNQLKQVGNSDDSETMHFRLDEHTSLVAKAGIERQPLSSFDADKLTIADKQILRLLNTQGMLCIPLYKEDTLFAVAATCMHSEQDEIHPRFLEVLVKQLTEQCASIGTTNNPNSQLTDIDALNTKVHEVVHEANNPLGIVSNYLASLSQKLNDKEDVQEELSILREELDRASNILLRLRDVDQKEEDSNDGSDINHEIQSLLTLYKSSLFLTKGISHTFSPDLAMTRHFISKNNLRQILTNLMKNAVEALPEGGQIEVSTNSSIVVDGSTYTEIKIEDNGPGIPETLRSALFSPVFSTKGADHSGLGLSITKKLVMDARGTITCRSDKTGTQFQILLPAK